MAWPRRCVSARSTFRSLPSARASTSRTRADVAVALGLTTSSARTRRAYRSLRCAPMSTTPTALRAASALVGVEGAAGVVAAVGFGVAAVTGQPSDRATALTLAAVLLVLGLGLLLVARGVLRQRPAAATPAYLAQFFALIVAYYQRHTLVAVTVALGLVAIATVVALATPQARAALRRPG